MTKVFVFSGTSEGRELCERLAEENIYCMVFVATEYGDAVMQKNRNISVNIGRLDKDDISKLITKEKPEYIIDATHPHAVVVTENIKAACDETGTSERYIRVSRTDSLEIANSNLYSDTIISVSSVDEAVKKLNEFHDGNILLTTGVKELSRFCTSDIKDRLIVRVLPGVESLNEVYKNGISTKAVIAMEGPFSEMMNETLIREYGVKVLVTKNSGNRGGYIEKIKACKNAKIKAIVIENPEHNSIGISVSDAVKKIAENIDAKEKNVFLVGAGVCNRDYLVPAAEKAVKNSQLIIGAKRMVEFGKLLNKDARFISEYNPNVILHTIKNSDEKNITVLYSGDTGLCSGSKGLVELLKDEESIKVQVIPGISSVSYLASKTGIQYSDYPFISMHGKECDYMSVVKDYKGFVAICSGISDVKNVAQNIFAEYKKNKVIFDVGYNLGSDDERIFKIESEDDVQNIHEGLYVISVVLAEQ